ncbi:MAG: insulinase family protein [Bacteroidetes bacterium]|nr:insulinase family protein [Bacteroidota bacterium]
MKLKNLYVFILSIILFLGFLSTKDIARAQNSKEVATFNPNDLIPFDQEVTTGEFNNGLRYYIKVNKKPENRAQLWLVVNAGSVLEDPDQQGLAHFAEHMAFNGTQHFAKHELIDYLESIGMKFGPEINAFTSFDETIYMLQVPTDSSQIVEKGFQILEDWAQYVSFEGEEIDKERGVVIEEWRLGRGANMRMLDKQLPVIFKGSRYAERLPIGKKEILDTFNYETLRRFYRDWYRPDLMAIVAVGDFDKSCIQSQIEKHFASIPLAKNTRKREIYPVPDHKETLFAIATDPEATNTGVSVYYKTDPLPDQTVGDYRRILMERLFVTMLNNRLYELLNQEDPPFLYGYSGKGRFVRSKSVYTLGAAVKDGGIERGLETLLSEALRVKRFGFTQTELDRTKIKLLRQMEQVFNEKDKTRSNVFAGECANHFLESEPMPGIEYEFKLTKELMPGIKLEEINDLVNKWITEENRVVLLNAPQREDNRIPSEQELLAVFKTVENKKIQAYVDEVSAEPLVKEPPKAAEIIIEKSLDKLGVTEWTLSNGVKAVLKPTDFKNDEIRFQAFSSGGNSLIDDDDYMSANVATDIIKESGVGTLNLTELNKKLSGKVVSVFPYISTLTEGFLGSASPRDMETMFQLIYLYMTSPRIDNESFSSYITRMKGFIANRSLSPESAFYDTIQVTLAQYHFRERPWSVDLLDEIELETLYEFYKDRYADASDFIFFFVGNFEFEKIKPLVKSYLGGLPSLNRNETWKDPGIRRPKGVIKKTVRKGIEPKSQVRLVFSGPMEWSRENNYALNSMTDVMSIKLREILREDMGGTYGVRIWSSSSLYPTQKYSISLSFGCDPERVEELTKTLFEQIDSMKISGPDDIYITKVRETQNREYETNLKENLFWLRNLQNSYYTKQNPEKILDYPQLVKTLSAEMIQNAARKYFNMNNYVQVVLIPETGEK